MTSNTLSVEQFPRVPGDWRDDLDLLQCGAVPQRLGRLEQMTPNSFSVEQLPRIPEDWKDDLELLQCGAGPPGPWISKGNPAFDP